ncbi:mammalian cell entry protein [Mycolicibacterium litorale]|uniref:mammalian cell entry protein n=1 Tax=Mycolicibacterium litorale TaxID=758802 RepID=UPI00162345D7|nr:mammalian cell entry protein [Mycolicibacterium litorale]
MSEQSASTTKPVRRRASRAAGPAKGSASESASGGVRVEAPAPIKVRTPKPAGPPPRRQPHRTLVAAVSLVVLALALAAVTTLVGVWAAQQREADAKQARDQRFVDTASQTVVNMFSYTQDTIDEDVNRFVDGTSGPLRDMLSQGNNVDNLKALFRDTEASAEAVINGAALEKVDDIADNAAVLVAVRVTITDIDGNNKPSQPYRLRVIVHEDDNGHMTGYDLKYPEGGN